MMMTNEFPSQWHEILRKPGYVTVYHTIFAYCCFSIAPPSVWNPSGTRTCWSSHSVVFLKPTDSNFRPGLQLSLVAHTSATDSDFG